MASLTKEAINASSLRTFDGLRAQDPTWRRRSPHIVRERGGLIHSVHFQGSQFSSREHATFTVNFAVSSPSIYEAWTGRSFPANPATALFPIQERIGHLMEGRRDYWWQVTSSTNLDDLAASVADTVGEVADSFFARYASLQAILTELRSSGGLPGLTKNQGPVIHGIIAATEGSPLEAEAAFRKAIADSSIAAFRSTIALVASRVGVSI